MEHEEKEFKGLMLPDIINLGDKEDALEKYPILSKYPEFSIKIKYFNRILKYISLIYDANSPLHIINHIPTRKAEAMTLAGFDKNHNGMFSEECENIMKCSVPEVVAMIMRYIRIQKNADFAQLVIFDESYHKQLEKMLTDDVTNSEKTKDFITNVSTLKREINTLRSALLNNDNNKNLDDALSEEIEEEQLLIRPELVAKALKDGKNMEKYLGG